MKVSFDVMVEKKLAHTHSCLLASYYKWSVVCLNAVHRIHTL